MKTFLTVLCLAVVALLVAIAVRGSGDTPDDTKPRPTSPEDAGVGALGRVEPCSEVLSSMHPPLWNRLSLKS